MNKSLAFETWQRIFIKQKWINVMRTEETDFSFGNKCLVETRHKRRKKTKFTDMVFASNNFFLYLWHKFKFVSMQK